MKTVKLVIAMTILALVLVLGAAACESDDPGCNFKPIGPDISLA